MSKTSASVFEQLLAHFELIVSSIKNTKYFVSLDKIKNGLASKKDGPKKEQLSNLKTCLEDLKKLAKEHNVHKWFGKVIRKRKTAKNVDVEIANYRRDLQKALLIFYVEALRHIGGQSKDNAVLWVDDNPDNNKKNVELAKDKYKVNVICKKTTKEATEYLSSHSELKTTTASHFRIITDYHREDEGDNAAKNLIEWLRKNGWDTPVLIFCGEKTNFWELISSTKGVTAATTNGLLSMFFESMSNTAVAKSNEEEVSKVEKQKEKKVPEEVKPKDENKTIETNQEKKEEPIEEKHDTKEVKEPQEPLVTKAKKKR